MEFYSCLKAFISLCGPPSDRFFLCSLCLPLICGHFPAASIAVRFRAGDLSTFIEIAANSKCEKLEINLREMGERTEAKFESRN